MNDFLHDPPRWKDRTDQARLAERSAGQMVRDLGTAEPLTGAQLARIKARVRAQRTSPHRLRFLAPATAVLLFGGVAAASAVRLDILPRWLSDIVRPGAVSPAPRMPAPPRVRTAPAAPARQAPTPPVAPAPTAEGTPAVLPASPQQETSVLRSSPNERLPQALRKSVSKTSALKASPVAEIARDTRSVAPVPAAPLPAVAAPTPAAASQAPTLAAPTPVAAAQAPAAVPTAEPTVAASPALQLAWADHQAPGRQAALARPNPETRPAAPAAAVPRAEPIKYLSAAIHALRIERSPESALALLDRHAGDLQKSSVSHEALLLRVEAMLKLNRQGEVLNLLDATPLAGVAASRTLLLTRGELRASAGRCPEAVTDFDLVLVQTQGHNKRALAGRAKCQP